MGEAMAVTAVASGGTGEATMHAEKKELGACRRQRVHGDRGAAPQEGTASGATVKKEGEERGLSIATVWVVFLSLSFFTCVGNVREVGTDEFCPQEKNTAFFRVQ